ncbi:hypothetical protein BC2230_10636 [Burkholderia cepacia]
MPAAPAREIRQGTLQLEIKTVQIHAYPDSLKNQFQPYSIAEVGNGSNFAPVCRRFV